MFITVNSALEKKNHQMKTLGDGENVNFFRPQEFVTMETLLFSVRMTEILWMEHM